MNVTMRACIYAVDEKANCFVTSMQTRGRTINQVTSWSLDKEEQTDKSLQKILVNFVNIY